MPSRQPAQRPNHAPVTLARVRIQMAAALLTSTDRPVIQIAGEVGDPTLSNFNRHFRRVMKTTPRQWRRRH